MDARTNRTPPDEEGAFMPIRIPDSLPATDILEGENIFVMTEHRAMHQDIRPLKVLLVNLMPTKIVTETQIMRKLSNTPLQVEVELVQTASHVARTCPNSTLRRSTPRSTKSRTSASTA